MLWTIFSVVQNAAISEWVQTTEGSATGQTAVWAAVSLGPCDSEDVRALEVSGAYRGAVPSLWKATIGLLQPRLLGFWSKALVSVAGNYSSFEKQVLACYSAFTETECITMSRRVTMWSGFPSQTDVIWPTEPWRWPCTAAAPYHQVEVVQSHWASEGSGGTSELHEVAQVLIVPTPVTLPSLSPPAPLASWEVSYDQLTEEGKTWTWLIDGSAWHATTTQMGHL